MPVYILSLILVGCGIFTEKAFSSVPIVFSGISNQTNSPVQITLNQPVEFLMTANVSSGTPFFFIIQNAQPIAQPNSSFVLPGALSSTISFSINGSGSYLVNTAINDGGINAGDVTSRDAYFYTILGTNISAGDLLTFSTGTIGGIPSNTNFDVPASGNYTTFLFNGNTSAKVSGFGVAGVPEPSAVSLLVVGLGGVMAMRRVRRKADSRQ